MAQDYGTGALEDKILIVIFIVLTILANAVYLFRYFRAPGVMYRNGHFVKISLALGNIILLTLFSYVVLARVIYEGLSELTCTTLIIFRSYLLFFHPYVFGFGLFALNLDFLFVQRATRPPRSKWASLILAVFLWVFTCITVLPMTLKGVDWNIYCYHPWTSDDWALFNVVGRLLPAILAILSCLFLLKACTRRRPVNAPSNEHIIDSSSTRLQGMKVDQTAAGEATQQTSGRTLGQAETGDESRNATLKAWEKRGLFLACVIYFCSVMPYTCYAFTFDPRSTEDDSSRSTTVKILLWISCLYPIAVPIAWIGQVQM